MSHEHFSPELSPPGGGIAVSPEENGTPAFPPQEEEPRPTGSRCSRRKVLLGAFLLLVLCGTAGGLVLHLQAGGDSEDITTAEDIAGFKKAVARKKAAEDRNAGEAARRDEQLQKAVLGEWELPEDGTYRLILKPDHTGTLIYKPNLKYKILLGWTERLVIQIRWMLENGHIDIWSLSGKPETAFKIAIKDRGARKYYRVEKVTPKRLVLHELKNGKIDRWRKIH